jgi:hypothetical protein
MAHNVKFEYVDIEFNPDIPSVKVKNIKSFLRLLNQYQAKMIFLTETKDEEGNIGNEFLFMHDKMFYRLNSGNFKSVEDFEDAIARDFPDAESYYEALHANIATYKEYEDCKKIGVVDKQLYTKAQKLGFIDAYEKFKKRCIENKLLTPKNFDFETYNSPILICDFATSKGFKDYGDFEKAFFLGFTDKITFDEAKIKGFMYAEDYINAVKMGFDQVKEYQEAKHLKIQNKFEYSHYISLKNQAKGIYSLDQVVLIVALKNSENGKKLSLKKLLDLLKQKEEDLKFKSNEDGSHSLPEWYEKKLFTEDEIRAFLSQESKIKDVGIFDSDGEYFEVWRISNQKIYIDGNNVAYNNQRKRENPSADDKPHCSNIKLVVEELKKNRFEEIIVIGDHGLNRKAPDANILHKMINDKLISFHEAPSKTEADEFFIKKAKADKCYIVTNDTFKDWKMKDSWISENIDRIRVPFMIDGNSVTLSGIEKLS